MLYEKKNIINYFFINFLYSNQIKSINVVWLILIVIKSWISNYLNCDAYITDLNTFLNEF